MARKPIHHYTTRSEQLREYAKQVVADWPPLTDEQRRDIAAILLAGPPPRGGDAA